MERTTVYACCLCAVVSMSMARAQQPEMPAPQKEHEWLQQFVGSWDTLSETTPGPDCKAMKCTGKISCKSVGGFWVLSEMKSSMMGTQMLAFQTIGYDPAKKKYIGTWVDSMNSHLWKYEGAVDTTGKILTLEAEGPDFTDPTKSALYRDVYEFKTKDLIAVSSQVRGLDGKWITFMTGTSSRAKE